MGEHDAFGGCRELGLVMCPSQFSWSGIGSLTSQICPDWRPVMRDQRAAVEEIDHAIGEAKNAAIDDGKNPDDHPPIDRALGWEGRFRKAMELLDSAERDLSQAETNGAAAGWRNASLGNVRNAKAFVAKAMRDSWWR